MSTLTVGKPEARRRPVYGWTLHDGFVVARRNLIQTIRVPELLFFSLVQPVIFVLLFAYVFGGAIPIPGDAAENAASELCLIPWQDVLGTADRINLPGTMSDSNWAYRIDQPVEELLAREETVKAAELMARLTKAGRRA